MVVLRGGAISYERDTPEAWSTYERDTPVAVLLMSEVPL